jgi:hypothetical protein
MPMAIKFEPGKGSIGTIKSRGPGPPPLTEGYVRKGGRNLGISQITERPAPPAAFKPSAPCPVCEARRIAHRLRAAKSRAKKAK